MLRVSKKDCLQLQEKCTGCICCQQKSFERAFADAEYNCFVEHLSQLQEAIHFWFVVSHTTLQDLRKNILFQCFEMLR